MAPVENFHLATVVGWQMVMVHRLTKCGRGLWIHWLPIVCLEVGSKVLVGGVCCINSVKIVAG